MAEQWMCAHQPVRLHTGLMAKLVVSVQLGASWFWHDLDTLAEAGSTYLEVPSESRPVKVRLLQKRQSEEKVRFDVGPVVLTAGYSAELLAAVKQLAHGRLPRPVLEEVEQRLNLFAAAFPPQKEFRSTLDFCQSVVRWVFPRVAGLALPNTSTLSELMKTQEWLEVQKSAWEKFSPQHFWVAEGTGRRQALESSRDSVFLVPKALPLVWCQRALGYHLVGGTGQKNYEAQSPVNMPATKTLVVTSRQGMPPIWRKFAPDFRPSELLLWLLGGQFDADAVVREEY